MPRQPVARLAFYRQKPAASNDRVVDALQRAHLAMTAGVADDLATTFAHAIREEEMQAAEAESDE